MSSPSWPLSATCQAVFASGLLLLVVLVVADTGPPFDPQNVAPLPELVGEEPPKLGGAGLDLVRSYADRLHYREVDGCNILRLEHDLDPELKRGQT